MYILNINDEYNLQNEFIKIRKLFLNLFTFELYFVESLKLKNIYLELLKNGNNPKSIKESKKIKGIYNIYQNECCVKKNDHLIELNKNLCFIEKEILNRFFYNITIKNSNCIINDKFTYLYKLFRNFYFLLNKKKGNFYKQNGFFLCTYYIKKFSLILNYLINDNKKNIYFQYIKKQLQKYSTIKEKRKKKKKKNGHYIYVYVATSTYKNDKKNSSKINNIIITYYDHKMSSYNYSIDRKRNNYHNLSLHFIYKNNKLKIDINKVTYVIEKAIYNDFYFNILNCIFYSLINKSIHSISNLIYSSYTCENTQNNEENKIICNNKALSNNCFLPIKILFSSFNIYQKYLKSELFVDELFLFKHIRILLKENIKKLLFLTTVNINRLYINLSFKYLFNLFLFYFTFLDINFYCSISLVCHENNLTTEEKKMYMTKDKNNKNCCKKNYEKYDKKDNYERETYNNNSNKIELYINKLSDYDRIHLFNISNNLSYMESETNDNKNIKEFHKNKINNSNLTYTKICIQNDINNNYNDNNNNNLIKKRNMEDFYTLCFFCSYNKLKKENISVIEKKKYFIFIIIYILQYNYITTIKCHDSFLSYIFNSFVKNFFYFKNFDLSYEFINKKLKDKSDHSHVNCYHKNEDKIEKNFNHFFKKVNKKDIYLKYIYNIINAEDLSLYNSHKKRKYSNLEINESNIQNNKSISKNPKKENHIPNTKYISSSKNKANKNLSYNISEITYTNYINNFDYLTSLNYDNKTIENVDINNKMLFKKNLNKENDLHENPYSFKKEKKRKNISIVTENNGYNNNLYYYINEKMKIFFENLKILLFPLLEKLYNKSILYINLHIYLFMIHSFFLLKKMKKENIVKMEEVALTKKRKTYVCKKKNISLCKKNHVYKEKQKKILNNIIKELSIYKYYDFLNLLYSNNNIILKKIKNKKIFFYLKENLENFSKWHIRLIYKIENFINTYKYKYKEILERKFFLLKDNEVNNKKYKKIFAINYIFYLKKGKNISMENRKNRLLKKRQHFIKINKDNCLEKYINILHKSIGIFHNIYININEDDFYVQTKKDFIIFNLKSKMYNHDIRNIYYEFKGKRYYVFDNLYTLKKTYKIHYINLCLLFYRYCFFFYNYNPLIFSFLFNNIYCICIRCLNKYLVIKCYTKNKIEKEDHDCFYKQNGILIKNRDQIFIRTFYYLVFFLIIRYQTFIGNTNHSGSHNCVPKRIMNILAKELEIKRECFSSPFNAVLKNYCSFFSDIDIFFGSSSNFFEFNLQSGSYEVNPPFDIFLINKLIIYILHNLKKELYELTFFLIIPLIKDKNYFYELLFSSPYISYYFFLKGNSYTFSTRLFDKREKEYTSTCDCFVFILQNKKARIQKKIQKKVVLKIKNLWKT
ncbi:conserved Plasmodium protein, unknown function [Plasmodium relictum]|uniref:PCIF1 WW domain-containing protein n=1 Tax=Plasmodium relictum TaxID=85471 RepID=A0A1J1H1Q8_PLARL|nr:conserved Plasmodium protein, unknown function [Plasmodium relictum]CRG98858.1 conserved Plasmodium protein, unknown function [Plasmodium relictum]